MAQPPRAAGNGDNFVRQVVADPKNVPDVMLLYGYLGASSEEGHERLYLSPDLSSYVEVPTGSILHRAQSAADQDPLGGVTLWVRKDAALKYKMAPAAQAAQRALAAYFAGAIQAAAQAATAPTQPVQPAAAFAQAAYRPQFSQALSCVCPEISHGWNACGGGGVVEAAQVRVTLAFTCNCTVFGPVCTNFHSCRTPCPAVSCGIECGGTHVANCPTLRFCPAAAFDQYRQPITGVKCPGHTAVDCTLAHCGGGVVEAQALRGTWFCSIECPTLGCPTLLGCPNPNPGSPFCSGYYGCGGSGLYCPQLQAAQVAEIPSLVCSYGPGCWFSWNACPTFVGCGPHGGSRFCPQAQMPVGAATAACGVGAGGAVPQAIALRGPPSQVNCSAGCSGGCTHVPGCTGMLCWW